MEPLINKTSFGSITVEGEKFTHDIFITLGGKVRKRKKKLSNIRTNQDSSLSSIPDMKTIMHSVPQEKEVADQKVVEKADSSFILFKKRCTVFDMPLVDLPPRFIGTVSISDCLCIFCTYHAFIH